MRLVAGLAVLGLAMGVAGCGGNASGGTDLPLATTGVTEPSAAGTPTRSPSEQTTDAEPAPAGPSATQAPTQPDSAAGPSDGNGSTGGGSGGGSSFGIGSAYSGTCSLAGIAPVTSSSATQLTLQCSGLPSTYLLAVVIVDDPTVDVTPSSGEMTVVGTVVDIATSQAGMRMPVIHATTFRVS